MLKGNMEDVIQFRNCVYFDVTYIYKRIYLHKTIFVIIICKHNLNYTYECIVPEKLFIRIHNVDSRNMKIKNNELSKNQVGSNRSKLMFLN